MVKCRRMKRPQFLSRNWKILDNESPRGYASSFIARKALRWTRILIRVDQRSKTASHFKNGIRIQHNTETFVPIVVLGLSTSSSSSLLSSTPMAPSRQEIDHPTSSSSSSTSTPMISSTVSSECGAGQERRDPCGIDHYPAAVSSKHVERQERPVPFRHTGMAARIQGESRG